jgi:hypothetical protein
VNVSDVLGIVGIAASLIGIPVAYILARRGRQNPDLRYAVDFDVLVSTKDEPLAPGVVLTSSGHDITSISRTRLALWNRRGDTIRGSDILQSDPLRIEFQDAYSIIHSKLVSVSRSQNQIDIGADVNHPNCILVQFDFLDASDGLVFHVVHQDEAPPKVRGTIRGVTIRDAGTADLSRDALEVIAIDGRLRRMRKAMRNDGSSKIVGVSTVIYLVGFIVTAGLAIRAHVGPDDSSGPVVFFSILGSLCLAGLLAMLSIAASSSRRRIPATILEVMVGNDLKNVPSQGSPVEASTETQETLSG